MRPKTARNRSEFNPRFTSSDLLEDNSSLVYCKLWKCAFEPSEMTKIVTMKMLSKLRSHYNRRGIFKFDKFTQFKDTKRTLKVWELCYKIITAEHELIWTEERFAIMQGIPVDDLYKEKAIVANDNRVTSDIFKWKLKQLRIMFYLDVLKDVQLEKIINIYKPKNGLYLHINCANNIKTFKLDYEHLLLKEHVFGIQQSLQKLIIFGIIPLMKKIYFKLRI